VNVAQIINAANPGEVARLYAAHWTDGEWADVATFVRFKSMLNAAVGVSGKMRAVVAPIANDFGEDDGIVRYEVDGDDDSGTHWSLSFTSWSEWKLMEVVDRSDARLSTDMLAMSLYYEMTWHGWPEEMIERRDEVFDRAEAVQNSEFRGHNSGDTILIGPTAGTNSSTSSRSELRATKTPNPQS
jgi:hypothetical protein